MSRGLARLPLTAARRWRRPRATLAPERFARLRRLSLAPLTGPCPSCRRRSSLHSGLWFPLFRRRGNTPNHRRRHIIMNQIQQLIRSLTDAPHDALIAAGMSLLPVLIVLWIVNRMRHPERGLLHALIIATVGFFLVPMGTSIVFLLWVRTGGASLQGAFVGMFVFVFGSWAFRRWIRSARSLRRLL